MKYTILIFFFTTFLWVQSCKTEEIDPNVSGKVIEGNINGKIWGNTNFRIGYLKKCNRSINLDITVYNENRFKRESFGIDKIPLIEGSFKIIEYDYSSNVNCLNDSTLSIKALQASYYTLRDDGDIIKDTYLVLDNPNEKNKLTVIKLDLTNKYIEGEFDVTFLLKRDENGNKFYKDSADTLRFRGVKFQASIVNLK